MEGLGAWSSPEGGVQRWHSDCGPAPAPATHLLLVRLLELRELRQEDWEKGLELRAPFPSLSLLYTLAPPLFHAIQGCLQSWPKSLSKEKGSAPGRRPAWYPAPGRPFLKHLFVEAAGSRPLCHGSRAGQPEA